MHPEVCSRNPRFAGVIAAAVLLAGGVLAQTPDPHAPAPDSGLIEESAEAMEVTTVIRCFCGTCSNQTLHECTCGTAARERGRVAAALADGEAPEALIALYVEEHGPQVRIVPELRGLDIVGYSVPFAAAIIGVVALCYVLRAWQRRNPGPVLSTVGGKGLSGELERGYRDRLERDLKELDR